MLSNPIWNFFIPLDDLIHDTVYPIFSDKLSEKKSILRRRAIIDTAVVIITTLIFLFIFGMQFYLVNYEINNKRYPTDLITLCNNIPEIQEFSQRHTDEYTLIYLYHYYEVGSHYADPEEFQQIIAYNHDLLASISDREFELLIYSEKDYYTNYTILAKKYLSDMKYFAYKRFLLSIIKIGIDHQDETIPQYELPNDEELLDAFWAKYDALELGQVDFDDIHEWHQAETGFLQVFLDLYDEGYDATPLIKYWYQ